ncbi:hypothetical protein MAR_037694 [Mya arenaria]|uniref:CABIT domain-containing protein n=1 Tax=Mya arenaria TaxID=6604 RepID=A0ABY7FP56_MYAAR|nr:hypothetical protein MAR_037694 [Mya arenaria]
MNKPEISRDEDIYHELLTLNEAVLNEDVPLSVRLSGDIPNISICENAGLQAGEQIQVLERRTLDVARVRVFGHESDDGSYSAGEAKPIGEFFIPAKFPGRLMLIRKPCSRKSFSCVAEVIDDMPKRICVEEDIMTIPPQEFGKNTSFISKGTILETIRVFTCLRNLETYIQCRFGEKTYYLKKSLQLQCSAIDDDTMYTLTDLQKLKVHPIFFKFVASESRGVVDVQRNAFVTRESKCKCFPLIHYFFSKYRHRSVNKSVLFCIVVSF